MSESKPEFSEKQISAMRFAEYNPNEDTTPYTNGLYVGHMAGQLIGYHSRDADLEQLRKEKLELEQELKNLNNLLGMADDQYTELRKENELLKEGILDAQEVSMRHGKENEVYRQAMEATDTLLAHLEDYTHGEEGKRITEARGIIQKALNK